jgi:hypothetical protein
MIQWQFEFADRQVNAQLDGANKKLDTEGFW